MTIAKRPHFLLPSLSVLGLSLPIFLFLWSFQLLRELGYWIEHGKTEIAVDGRRQDRTWRVFSGAPRSQPERTDERGFAPGRDLFAVVDAGFRQSHGQDAYRADIAVAGSRCSVVSRLVGGKRRTTSTGWEAGTRRVTFIFSGRLKDDADWVRAGLLPDFVVIRWADWPGYLRGSLHAELFIESLLLAAFLVFHVLYLRRRWRPALLPGLTRHPSGQLLRWLSGIALTGIVIYQFPAFHNVVFLWFGAWALLAVLAWKTLLPASEAKMPLPGRLEVALLLAILAAGMVPRALHLDWGRPLMLHPDEYAFTAFPPKMAETNTLNPMDFERPNHPSIYTNSMVYGVASHLVFGQPLPQSFSAHEFFYHLLSRWLVALWGGIGILAAWYAGRQFSPAAGLWAAALLAVHPLFIEHAHFATPDVPMTAMQLFSIALVMRFMKSGSWRDLAPSVLWVSLAAGEKYPGVLYLLAPLFALVWQRRHEGKRLLDDLVRLEATFLVGLFAFAPYVFLKAHLVLLNLISESRPTHLGSDGLSWAGNLGYYANRYLQSGSWGLLALFLIGGVLAFRKYGVLAIPAFSGLFYWIIVSRLPLHWGRWSLPMAVTPLLLSALALAWFFAYSGRIRWMVRLSATACAAVIFLGQAFRSELVLVRLGATDTRVAGQAPLARLGIDTANAVVSQYTPLASAWKPGFDFVAAACDSEASRGRRYAVASSSMYDRYLAEPTRYRREASFYRSLFQQPELLHLDPTPIPFDEGRHCDWELARQLVPLHAWQQERHGRIFTGPQIRVFELVKGGVTCLQEETPLFLANGVHRRKA